MADPAQASAPERDAGGVIGTERVVAFSDSVFAVAITLLVFQIDIPKLPSGGGSALDRALDGTIPDVISYFIGFAVIGLFWVGHHRFFDSLRGFDERMLHANLLFLAFIALIPFPTATLGDHPAIVSAVILFALAVAAAGLADSLMLWMALRRRLLAPAKQAQGARLIAQSLAAPAVFLASIPVALLDPRVAPYVWLGLLVARRLGGAALGRRRQPY